MSLVFICLKIDYQRLESVKFEGENHVKKKLALVAAPIVLLAASASAAENRWGIKPYVGADAEFRHMDYHKAFGGNIINHDAPQGNVYGGIRLGEYFAVEAGYEATKRKTRASSLKTGDTLAGFILPLFVGAPRCNLTRWSTTSQTKGLHANILGFFPICELYRLKLIGMVGFARLKAKSTLHFLANEDGDVLDQIQGETINIFRTKKTVLRLGAGLQHMIDCNWGIRGMVKWEASKKLKMNSTNRILNGGGPVTFSIRPKNSVIYSIGAFYTF